MQKSVEIIRDSTTILVSSYLCTPQSMEAHAKILCVTHSLKHNNIIVETR